MSRESEPTRKELENSRPFDVHRWSDYPEVNAAVDKILNEILELPRIRFKSHRHARKYVKVLILDLYLAYYSDPDMYIGYSRNVVKNKSGRYNMLHINTKSLAKVVDCFIALGYVSHWKPKQGARGMQSRMRATQSLIDLIVEKYYISPLMVKRHEEAPCILMRDANKELIDFEKTTETQLMTENLKVINNLLENTLINLYLPDDRLFKLNRRMISGKDVIDEDIEMSRGAIDFSRKYLYRVFNNEAWDQGGRFYGGWWLSIPREYRKYIRINRMNTVEVDFSAIHINLIYWKAGLPVPDSDPYTLEGFPPETRNVVKKCLLTIINAKTKPLAMKSINERIEGIAYRVKAINGVKKTEPKIFDTKDKIILPEGVDNIETIVEAFEQKHEAIKSYFFSNAGIFLQKTDSQIAEEIMLRLAKAGVPCLPLHDSFIVSHPQEQGLNEIMIKAFQTITDRLPKVDAKMSLNDANLERGLAALEDEYDYKMVGGNYSEEFKRSHSIYYAGIEEWTRVTGRPNMFPYSRNQLLNKEVYD